MGRVGRFVTDPKAGAYCQIALDSGEKILVNHDKGGFKGGHLSITTTKWLGLATGDTLFTLDLDTPGGQAVLAGLTAGALSMALGEYVSVASQRDIEEADLRIERRALQEHPVAELKELADIWESRGIERGLAMEVARQLTDQDALAAHARDELGLTEARLYGHGPEDGVGGFGAFFLLLDEPQVYGLPRSPADTTRHLSGMWRAAAAAAGALVIGMAAACAGGRR